MSKKINWAEKGLEPEVIPLVEFFNENDYRRIFHVRGIIKQNCQCFGLNLINP